jgi:hypothetical protein
MVKNPSGLLKKVEIQLDFRLAKVCMTSLNVSLLRETPF